MSTLREAAQQALEALEFMADEWGFTQKANRPERWQAIEALRAALAQQEQEQWPVAYLWQHSETGRTRVVMPDQVVTADENWLFVGSLYTHPPRREWVSLTEEELNMIYSQPQTHKGQYARAIEAALKERNT